MPTRASDYTLVPVADPEELRAVLDRAIGREGQVRKERHLYRIDNVRIHLDRVEGLGDFLELEAIVDAGHREPDCHRSCELLLDRFGIPPEARLAVAYFDLLTAR
jgi:predicted adenylyl cyclase CyaB